MNNSQDPQDKVVESVRRALFIVISPLFALYWIGPTGAPIAVYVWPRPPKALLTELVHTHFAAIVGLPTAALMSFCVVWIVRSAEGPLQLETFGLRLKGASGPILLWIVAFLAMVFALKLVW